MADNQHDNQRPNHRPSTISPEEKDFLFRGRRFSSRVAAEDNVDLTTADPIPDRREMGRRSGGDRRCGSDTRSVEEQFLQGERRSGLDRRSARDRRQRSFKKARAFVRALKLKSETEWHEYLKSGRKPDDIPAVPNDIYSNQGWAGWGDWLGSSPFREYLSRCRSMSRTYVERLRGRLDFKRISGRTSEVAKNLAADSQQKRDDIEKAEIATKPKHKRQKAQHKNRNRNQKRPKSKSSAQQVFP
jgi:hypothetical protein